MVTMAHDSLPPVAITDAITVVAPALIGTGGISLSATKAADTGPVTVATFTDPTGPDDPSTYSATIDWGDGSTSDGEISRDGSTFTVTGSHVYLTTGPKTITVTLKHQGSPGVTVSSTATVSNPAVSPTFSPFETVAGVAATNQLVATFLDPSGPDAASSYTATIDWGDGTTSAGTIEEGSGVFMVTGTHTYAVVGTYTVTVTIVHGPSPAAIASGTVSAGYGLVSPTGGLDAPFASAVAAPPVVATFTDPNGAGATTLYSAVINWGDGLTSTGTISGPVGRCFQRVRPPHLLRARNPSDDHRVDRPRDGDPGNRHQYGGCGHLDLRPQPDPERGRHADRWSDHLDRRGTGGRLELELALA